MLVLAEGAGRRETMLEYFGLTRAASRRPCDDFARLQRRDRPLHARRRPAALGFRARRPAARRHHRERALRAAGAAAARARSGGAGLAGGHAARPVGGQDRRPGGAREPRHRPLSRAADHGSRRRQTTRIPHARIRRRRQALRAGVEPAPDLPLQRRAGGSRAAAPARQRAMGKGEEEGGAAGARHRRRAAQPLRPARGARRAMRSS